MLFGCLTKFISAATALAVVAASPVEKRQSAAVYYSCTKSRTVAITFDDGPYAYESGLVDYLNSQGVKATFFVNGNNWDCIYDQYQALQHAYNSGHMIGDHTWAHKDLTTLTWDQIHDEMWRVELAMRRILGVAPAFMRPPYGSFNDLVTSAAYIRNQSVVIWDFDSGDSTGSSVSQSEQAYQNLINSNPNNILALNHETYQSTAQQVIPNIVPRLKAAGYKFATVADCLGLAPYSGFFTPEQPNSGWTC